MTTRVRVAVLSGAVALLSFGCWLTKPPPVTPTPPDGGFADASAGTAFKDCSDVAVHNALLQIGPDIQTDLALGPVLGLQALEALAAAQAIKLGGGLAAAELWCGVQWAMSEAAKQFNATGGPGRGDSIEATKVATAKAYLAAHPSPFTGAQ